MNQIDLPESKITFLVGGLNMRDGSNFHKRMEEFYSNSRKEIAKDLKRKKGVKKIAKSTVKDQMRDDD